MILKLANSEAPVTFFHILLLQPPTPTPLAVKYLTGGDDWHHFASFCNKSASTWGLLMQPLAKGREGVTRPAGDGRLCWGGLLRTLRDRKVAK
jgi:hypothetical protein